MNPLNIMVIAGEASGDANAAELVRAMTGVFTQGTVRFFGAGGPKMAGAGVELLHNLVQHSVVGLLEVFLKIDYFMRLMDDLVSEAARREPDVIVLVDFGGFNSRFAREIRRLQSSYADWRPLIVRYVSPQVWASREGRAYQMPAEIDLLLCLFAFEKEWYARRVPQLRVEFVGHPIVDRHFGVTFPKVTDDTPTIVLLPGSRKAEIDRHLPVMLEACKKIDSGQKVKFEMVLPGETILTRAKRHHPESLPNLKIQTGGLAESLSRATIAMASTGTVLLECAWFGVPTVAMYKTSRLTYEIGRRVVRVPYLSMPNLLVGKAVFPEFIQNDASPEKIAQAALDLLDDSARREQIRAQLRDMAASLGEPGTATRAAQAIRRLVEDRSRVA